MRRRRADEFTPEEDKIVLSYRSLNAAYIKLGRKRTRGAIKSRRWRLRQPDQPKQVTQGPGLRRIWTKEEEDIVRRRWPTIRNANELLPLLPRFNVWQIRSKAGSLKLKRLFNGDDFVPFEGHRELLDQIRIRARQDGVPLYRLDEECQSGHYFRGSHWKRNRVNLLYVARAVEFFGGSLVIDWADR